jgi:hypothetical protein
MLFQKGALPEGILAKQTIKKGFADNLFIACETYIA